MMKHGDPGGQGTQALHDFTVRFGKAVSSSLGEAGDPRFNITGVGDMNPDDPAGATDDAVGERALGVEMFGAMGIVGRQLPPGLVNGQAQHMEVMCLVTADGLQPFAVRDLRLKMGGAAPAEGTLAFVGYGGGFHSVTPVAKNNDPMGGGTLHVLYCPYDFDANGVAQKAHAVIMDPTPGNESIQLIHADGAAVMLTSDGVLLKNADGDGTIEVGKDPISGTAKITLNAGVINLSGNVVLGKGAGAGLPLLPGPASPGSVQVFVFP